MKSDRARPSGGAEQKPKTVGAQEAPAEFDEKNQAEEILEEEGVDEQVALRAELEEARAKEAEYLDGWQRALAELANARKRFDRDRDQAYTHAKVGMLLQIIPVIDDFERAFESMPENQAVRDWAEGVRLIYQKFSRLLAQEGIEPIDAVGAPFDPCLHEAVTHEPSDTVPAGEVIGCLQKGYRLGDRVLRPSMVRVSAGPLPAPESKSSDAAACESEETNAA